MAGGQRRWRRECRQQWRREHRQRALRSIGVWWLVGRGGAERRSESVEANANVVKRHRSLTFVMGHHRIIIIRHRPLSLLHVEKERSELRE